MQLIDLVDEYRRRYPNEPHAARLRRFALDQPRCFERDCFDDGHVTGSAWVVDARGERTLLLRHRKLGKWLQPGGHSDGDPDTLNVARREAWEETGLDARPLSAAALDIDIHRIPAMGAAPAHLHYDVRFAFEARSRRFRANAESCALAWVALNDLAAFTQEESILRMARKFAATR